MRIRERPSLDVHFDVESPGGRHFRWAHDAASVSDIPGDSRWSSTMPGGWESLDNSLLRRPGVDSPDLDPFSTIQVLGVGESVVGEYRLQRVPRVSGGGGTAAVNPSAVGYQTHLDDNKTASMIIIDRDLSRWGEPSLARRLALIAASFMPISGQSAVPDESGASNLMTQLTLPWVANTITEPAYDAGSGNAIGMLKGNTISANGVSFADAQWAIRALLDTSDAFAASDTLDVRVAGSNVDWTLTAGGAGRRFAAVHLYYGAAVTTAGGERSALWRNLRVIGDHGLTLYGSTADEEGVLMSDVVKHAVSRFAPLLNITEDSVQQSSLVVSHITFPEATTAAEIVRQATRFGLQDWAVWENQTFYWHERGARSRHWRARIGPAQLEETGPQTDRAWESIQVQYQDVDGSNRTVGPPGSGADTETSALKDADPENPANKVPGLVRRDLLVMGVGTAASAIEVGVRFLEQTKLLDSSGRARIVGYVLDDRGALYPYHEIRAGDDITFVDAADTSARRIIRVEHSIGDQAASIDLDAPPEGLAALLERLSVVLVPLGF